MMAGRELWVMLLQARSRRLRLCDLLRCSLRGDAPGASARLSYDAGVGASLEPHLALTPIPGGGWRRGVSRRPPPCRTRVQLLQPYHGVLWGYLWRRKSQGMRERRAPTQA